MDVTRLITNGFIDANLPIVLVGLVSVCVLIIVLNLYFIIKKQHDRAKLKRKVQPADFSSDPGFYFTDESAVTYDGDRNKAKKFLGFIGGKISDKGEKRQAGDRLRFLRAGYRGMYVNNIFWGIKLLLLVASIFASVLLVTSSLLTAKVMAVKLMVILVLAYIGFYLPDLVLRIKTDRRRAKIIEGFPDALDLLVVCVEAGLGLESAIFRVAKEMKFKNKPLSEEFESFNMELSAGKTRRDALKDLGERIHSDDAHSLITLLIQTDKLGTSVAKAMRVYSDTFRSKRYMRAEEKAAQLTVKLVIPLILFIFPSIFVVLMGPAVLKIIEVFSNK